MGIAGLWAELLPARGSTDMAALRGRSVAIDLSIWICESLALFNEQKGLHKRLMLKVIQLVHFGVYPVFVIDGISPNMKAETLRKRREQRQRAAGNDNLPTVNGAPGDGGGMVGGGNSMFAWVLEEWKALLAQLGLPVVQSQGEAEAVCAQLNARGHVDGCITKDGDSFLFGAKRVYSKFSCDIRKQKEMCVYEMSDIEKMGYSRQDLVAMALLVGSDYGSGVNNVAWKKAKELCKALKGEDMLGRLQGWRDNKSLDEIGSFKEMSKPTHCSYCGHEGNLGKHRKGGCSTCETTELCVTGTPCSCEYHQREQEYEKNAVEINIRRKALEDSDFPSQEIISAFMNPAIDEDFDLTWRRPDFVELKKFMESRFGQSGEQAHELTLKYLTAHDLQVTAKAAEAPATCKSQPDHIIKAKKENHVDMLQIEWKTIEGVSADLAPLLTTERRDMFESVFSDMVEVYDDDIEKLKNAAHRKLKRKGPCPDSKQRTLESMRPVRRRLDFSSPTRRLDFGKSSGSQAPSTSSSGPASDIMVYIDSDSGDEVPSTSQPAPSNVRKSPRKVKNSSVMDKPEFQKVAISSAAFLVKSAAHALPCSVSDCPDCLETRCCDSAPASAANSSPDTTPKKDNKRKSIKEYYSMRKKTIVSVGKPHTTIGGEREVAVPAGTQRKAKPESAAKQCSAKMPKNKLSKSGITSKRLKACKNQSRLDQFITKHLR